MSYMRLYDLLPEIALEETRTITVLPTSNIIDVDIIVSLSRFNMHFCSPTLHFISLPISP